MTDAEGWAEVQRLATQVAWQWAGDLGSRLSPLNLAAMVVLCLVIYAVRRPAGSFLGWLFPARIYRHPSFRLDLWLWLLNGGILLFVAVNQSAVAAMAAAGLAALIGAEGPPAGTANPLLAALIIFLVADFLTYWVHRASHDLRWLWPIHALHHSAEELNPVTAYRQHPVYAVLTAVVVGTGIGLAQGAMLVLLTGTLDVALLAGVNLFYALFNLFASNLRHSHIWLRYPRAVEHILISPAQHQCHHSIEPRHHNRNYGEVLALWDWLFGTLYLPTGDESIRFGLGDASGHPLPQPHPTLRRALTVPLRDAAGALRQDPRQKVD